MLGYGWEQGPGRLYKERVHLPKPPTVAGASHHYSLPTPASPCPSMALSPPPLPNRDVASQASSVNNDRLAKDTTLGGKDRERLRKRLWWGYNRRNIVKRRVLRGSTQLLVSSDDTPMEGFWQKRFYTRYRDRNLSPATTHPHRDGG